MTPFIRLLRWVLKAAVFFVLFAFALNNQHDATVYLLFGHQWRGPVALIVMCAFILGVVIGVVGMLPGWWRRRAADKATAAAPRPCDPHSSLPPPHGI